LPPAPLEVLWAQERRRNDANPILAAAIPDDYRDRRSGAAAADDDEDHTSDQNEPAHNR
jgi:hypothetical protein